MNLPHYELSIEKSLIIFEFTSEGKRGKISKLIKISETELKSIYNLGFGDKISETNDFDDTAVSNNGDSEKVLATIASAVYIFTEWKRNVWIYMIGSTKSRTRLYRMGITKYLDIINKDFIVLGLLHEEWEIFQNEARYEAFLIRRKNSNFEL